jgi:N-acetylneuraminic acid mutarotase
METVAPSPIARTEAQGAAVNGKLYLFGGYINTTYTPTRRADVYNPTNNTWTRIKDLPKGLTHSGTAVDGTHIYLAGGYPAKSTGGQSFATTDVWKYNVETNTWSSMPPLPEARGSGA